MKLHMLGNLFGLESSKTQTGAPQPMASFGTILGFCSYRRTLKKLFGFLEIKYRQDAWSFFKKMIQHRPLLCIFRSFQRKNTIFTTNKCEKCQSIQYTVPGFEPTMHGTISIIRWSLILAQVVSCCVYNMPKKRQFMKDYLIIAKFV